MKTTKITYAEELLVSGKKSLEDLKKNNLLGQAVCTYNQAGKTTVNKIDLTGKPALTSTYIIRNYKDRIDWNKENDLLDEPYFAAYQYNALGQVIKETLPHNENSKYKGTIKNTYNQVGLLDSVHLKSEDEKIFKPVLTNHAYDATLKLTGKKYGCNVSTAFDYEETTQKLINIKTSNNNQDITYSRDPMGNITQIHDASQNIQLIQNQDYDYDPLYQLTHAKGRQQIHKQNLSDTNNPALEPYAMDYGYDNSGNLIFKNHISQSRHHLLAMSTEETSNRIATYKENGTASVLYGGYDQMGNSIKLAKDNKQLTWDFRNNLKSCTDSQFTEYYVYSGVQRVRKVKVNKKGSVVSEKLYIGAYERKTDYPPADSNPHPKTSLADTVRHDLKIGDFLILHNFENPPDPETPSNKWLYRYKLTNNINSVSLELDKNGNRISYEEYFPYGGSALSIPGEDKHKEYGWVGQEKDDFSGLIYFGARYYNSFFCRWIKPDPAGPADGLNIFVYVNGNPVTHYDVGGYVGWDAAVLGIGFGGFVGLYVHAFMTDAALRPIVPPIIAFATSIAAGFGTFAVSTFSPDVGALAYTVASGTFLTGVIGIPETIDLVGVANANHIGTAAIIGGAISATAYGVADTYIYGNQASLLSRFFRVELTGSVASALVSQIIFRANGINPRMTLITEVGVTGVAILNSVFDNNRHCALISGGGFIAGSLVVWSATMFGVINFVPPVVPPPPLPPPVDDPRRRD